MAKQVLGDNPFQPPASATEAATPAAGRDADPPAAGRKPATPAAGRTAAPPATDRDTATPPAGGRSRAAGARTRPPSRPSRGRTRKRAPEILGAEATPSPTPPEAIPEYGPSLDRGRPRETERGGIADEFRMMERWVRDRLHPALAAERRQPPFAFLWKCWRRLAMHDRSEVVDEFGRDPIYSGKVEPVLDFLYHSYFRVETDGLEHVPDGGRALIVANHSGALPYDAIMLMHAVRVDHPRHRELRPLTEDFVFHFPYLGTLVNRIGGVRACPENAERLLDADQLVAVFPEGIKGIGKLYRERYQLQRFGRGGFIRIALRTDSPIIPAAVVGAEEIHPMVGRVTWMARNLGIPYIPITPTFPWLGPLGLIPLPTKWTIRFGAPLYFNAEYGAAAADDRILVNRLAESVRSNIQEMIDGVLATRKSILFG